MAKAKIDKGLQPHKACDVDLEKIKFPVYVMKKLDGCRMLNLFGEAIGRSMKKHANLHITCEFSKPCYQGLDGEVTTGAINTQDLCRKTTSVVNTIEGTPEIEWWVFDYITNITKELPYRMRYEMLKQRVKEIGDPRVKVVEAVLVNSLDELLKLEKEWLSQGFEGVIGRSLDGKHKSGRATMREGAYWRLKRMSDAEGVCVGLVEAVENTNPAKINELGLSERSTHKENLVPKGMIGTIIVEACNDILVDGKVLIKKGQHLDIGPGQMTHEQRKYFWEHKDQIYGKICKFQFFGQGVKDKLRFPLFLSFRAESDMSE